MVLRPTVVIAGSSEALPPGDTDPISVLIPEGVTEIKSGAFANCGHIVMVMIPASVRVIEPEAFCNCSELEFVNFVEEENFSLVGHDKNLSRPTKSLSDATRAAPTCGPTSSFTLGTAAFSGCSSLRLMKIPDGCSTIPPKAFFKCSSLKSITIPNTVHHVAKYAFYECSSLASVAVPEFVEDYAFYNCKRLQSVTFSNVLARVGCYSFFGCSSLGSVILPPDLKIVDCYSFYQCGMTSVILPNSVEMVGHLAFGNCVSLVTATIPGETVQFSRLMPALECQVFTGCHNLQHVIAPAMLASPKSHFRRTPVLSNGGLVPNVPGARHRAWKLQFWSHQTHYLCSLTRRRWVRDFLFVLGRLSKQGVYLPWDMIAFILGMLPRHELGPAV
eukprot:m.77020 g.77020  ORF g.77020 m.77020 type:complete len:388 (+) comp10576_c0_seq3:479-1642(+)